MYFSQNSTINERFRAFYLGFHSVCASNALIMLRPEEVEQLVCGSQVQFYGFYITINVLIATKLYSYTI